jgi:ubiquinone biosynthesis monooxygenase Coq6
MQVWDGVSDARITFDASELGPAQLESGSGEMARLTENLNLQRALLRHISTIPEVQLHDKVKVASIQREQREGGGGWPLVHLSDGRVIRTRLLVRRHALTYSLIFRLPPQVGADGFNSPVRSYAGISSYGWAYNTQAIVATLSHPPRGAFQSPNTTAYQRFLPTGPIAFLPLSPTTSSLVWSTKPDIASALTKGEPDVLVNLINAAFRLPEVSVRYLHNLILEAQKAGKYILPAEIQAEVAFRERSHSISPYSAYSSSLPSEDGIPPSDSLLVPPVVTSIQPGTIASFPLRFNHADSYIGEGEGARTVLVGDAAHTVHPLAGQGLNLGLADAECLVRCIEEAIIRGGDVGESSLSYACLLNPA